MGDPLTREQLAEIERVTERATPGPWEYGNVDSIAGGSLYGKGWMIASLNYETDLPHRTGSPLLDSDFRTPEVADTNGAFIAMARTAIPDLLAAVRARDEEITELRETLRRWAIYWHSSGGLCAPPVNDTDRVLLVRGESPPDTQEQGHIPT